MPNYVQSLRSSIAGNRPINRQPGELYVNFADNQLGVINTSNNAQDLIGVRFFSTAAAYAIGDHVIQAGSLYKATANISPGLFLATQWTMVAGSVIVGDTPPSNPQQGNLWFDSIGGQLYVYFNDGTSSQWVVAVNPLGYYLQTSGGTLTGPLILAADPTVPLGASTRQYVDNSRYGDNRIINGDMRIDQRNFGFTGSLNGYTIDRWNYTANQSGKGIWVRGSSIAPGFPYSLVFASTAAYTSLTNDIFQFGQTVEADMISDFAWGSNSAQPVTLSFWALCTTGGGTYSGSIANYAGTRSYPFTFVLPTNLVTKIIITIPGDTSGTWVMSGNGGGLWLRFDLGCGSAYRGPANTWASANYIGANNSVSFVATNGANLYFTSVKLEIGSIATPFNHYSLAKCMNDCQRYYETSYVDSRPGTPGANCIANWLYIGALPSASYTISLYISYKVTKRVTPSVIIYSSATGLSGVILNNNTSSDIAATMVGNGFGFLVYPTTPLPTATGANLNVAFTANAEL